MGEKAVARIVDEKTGDIHVLSGRIVTVGSSSECHVRLPGKKAPSRAAHFMFGQGTYRIQALAPAVRIEVNGEAIEADGRRLVHGDRFSVAGSHFEYRDREGGGDEGGAAAAGPVEELVGVVVSLLTNRDEEVFDGLVSSVSRLLRCDAARVVAEAADGEQRRTIARYPQSAGLERFSSRAIDWAAKSSQTVLMHDEDWRDGAESMRSLEKNRVASVLCAPLKEGDTILGYLYLDRLQKSEQFTEADRAFCDTLAPLFSTILGSHEERRRQRETIARLQGRALTGAGGMIYESEVMTQVVSQAAKLARTDSPILILGETGTGKELMARFVHENSSRGEKPFKAINCGAIPENLMESELFGHEKGAFTGASQRTIGLLEAAGGGTVFLDEVGELPIQLQVKLLRVLQESEIVRVGGTDTIGVDIRILAATNRELEKDVADGRFRQDLFFRLNVLTISLPPLRERGRDVALLAEFFLKKYCEQFGLSAKALSGEARSALLAHSWPGNIRELDNVVQKTVLLSSGRTIRADEIDFPRAALFGPAGVQAVTTLKDARSQAERQIIVQTLARTAGNISMAAKILDIDRKWLMKKMDELGVNAGQFRGK